MGHIINEKKYIITGYIDKDQDQDEYTIRFKNSGVFSIKFMPDGPLNLDSVKLELWRDNASVAIVSKKPPTEITTCIENDESYKLYVKYSGEKPKKNKYYLVIEEIESFDIDMYREPYGTRDRDNALLIQMNENIINDARSSYDYYKIKFDKDERISFNVRPLFEDIDIRIKIYRENTLKVSGSYHNYQMEVEKNRWYYIAVRRKEGSGLKSGHNFYLLNVESDDIKITSSCIYCPPSLVKKKVYEGTEKISGKKLNEINDWLTMNDNATEFALTIAIGAGLAAVASGISVTVAPFAIAFSLQSDKVISAIKDALWQSAAAYAAFKLLYKSANVSNSLLESMRDNTVPNIEVSYKFQYIRHGSNDGAYFLTELEIVEA